MTGDYQPAFLNNDCILPRSTWDKIEKAVEDRFGNLEGESHPVSVNITIKLDKQDIEQAVKECIDRYKDGEL